VVLGLGLPGITFAQNTISLATPAAPLVEGCEGALDLAIDFSELALGGGVQVRFDPARLGFDGFAYDPNLPDDPNFRLVCPSGDPSCDPFQDPNAALIAFGHLDGIGGSEKVGQLQLTPAAPGLMPLTLREDDGVAGPFVGIASFSAPVLNGVTLDVLPSSADPNCTGLVGLDSDGDGIPDGGSGAPCATGETASCNDNCPFEPNNEPGDVQRDTDGDGQGDACECGNVNRNTTVDIFDALNIAQSTLTPPIASMNNPRACDSDDSGSCDIFDALRVAQGTLTPPLAPILQTCPSATVPPAP
jgi:hypothetical protein